MIFGTIFAASAYIYDVWMRPAREARKARKLADGMGKPMLNVGAGTPESSLRARVLGPQLVGDVNLDIAASKEVAPGPDRVSYGDVQKLPFPDKKFGVAFTSHLLEHVDDPEKAKAELERVADKVVNVTPAWWAPHTWLYTDHQWYISGDGTAVPLWTRNPNRQAWHKAIERIRGNKHART